MPLLLVLGSSGLLAPTTGSRCRHWLAQKPPLARTQKEQSTAAQGCRTSISCCRHSPKLVSVLAVGSSKLSQELQNK